MSCVRDALSARHKPTLIAKMCTLNGRPAAGDVLIVTSPKCGTTWVQQIVHQLRSRGSMDFEEISMVVPWIEMAHDLGQVRAAWRSRRTCARGNCARAMRSSAIIGRPVVRCQTPRKKQTTHSRADRGAWPAQDLNADQGFEPRAFKTHCWYDHCPKAAGAKYIVVVRGSNMDMNRDRANRPTSDLIS